MLMPSSPRMAAHPGHLMEPYLVRCPEHASTQDVQCLLVDIVMPMLRTCHHAVSFSTCSPHEPACRTGEEGTVARLLTIARELGPSGLFAGLGARMVMVAVLTASQFAVYGDLKRLLGIEAVH